MTNHSSQFPIKMFQLNQGQVMISYGIFTNHQFMGRMGWLDVYGINECCIGGDGVRWFLFGKEFFVEKEGDFGTVQASFQITIKVDDMNGL